MWWMPSPRRAMKRPMGESSSSGRISSISRSPTRKEAASMRSASATQRCATRSPKTCSYSRIAASRSLTASPRCETRRSITPPGPAGGSETSPCSRGDREQAGDLVQSGQVAQQALHPELALEHPAHHLPARPVEVVRHPREADPHVAQLHDRVGVRTDGHVPAGLQAVADEEVPALEVERDALSDVGDEDP